MNIATKDKPIIQNEFSFEISGREKNKLESAIEVLKAFFDPVPNITQRPSNFYLYKANEDTYSTYVRTDDLRGAIQLMEALEKASSVRGTFKYEYEYKAGN